MSCLASRPGISPHIPPLYPASYPTSHPASHPALHSNISHSCPTAHRYIGKCIGEAPHTATDKPCLMVKYHDNSVVTFYIDKHPRAKRGKKHIYLKNREVLVEPTVVEPTNLGDTPP